MSNKTEEFTAKTTTTIAAAWASGGALTVAVYDGAGAGTQTAALCYMGYTTTVIASTEEYDGVNIVVDSESVNHIQGATLDYKEGLMETGFSIDNPNVSRTCGCGNSFS